MALTVRVEADACGVAGVGAFAEPVDGDAAEPAGEVVAYGAVGGGDGHVVVLAIFSASSSAASLRLVP